MEWFKKHTDALMVMATIVSCMLWMNGKFNDIEKDIAIIKTVLIMKDILPKEMAKGG